MNRIPLKVVFVHILSRSFSCYYNQPIKSSGLAQRLNKQTSHIITTHPSHNRQFTTSASLSSTPHHATTRLGNTRTREARSYPRRHTQRMAHRKYPISRGTARRHGDFPAPVPHTPRSRNHGEIGRRDIEVHDARGMECGGSYEGVLPSSGVGASVCMFPTFYSVPSSINSNSTSARDFKHDT